MAVQCLSESQQKAICGMYYIDGYTKSYLAHHFGVSLRTIGRVLDSYDVNDTMDALTELDEELGLYDIEPTNTSYFFVASGDTINITKLVDGELAGSVGIDTDHPKFDEASDLIWSSRGSQEALEQAFTMLDVKTSIETYSDGLIEVNPEQGRVTYDNDGHTINFSGKLVPRLIEALEQKEENPDRFEGLVNFATRLIDNPSNRAVNELYDFLDAACIDINVHGDVLCYKKVSSNYHDIFSGTMDNSPGMTVSVPRNMVDEDSERTCSHGLHVCSSAYLPYYGWGDDCKVVLVAVDPADFVSIPKDYYGTDSMGRVKAKARVCKYEVLSDETDRFM